jgi:hypothetical protein
MARSGLTRIAPGFQHDRTAARWLEVLSEFHSKALHLDQLRTIAARRAVGQRNVLPRDALASSSRPPQALSDRSGSSSRLLVLRGGIRVDEDRPVVAAQAA